MNDNTADLAGGGILYCKRNQDATATGADCLAGAAGAKLSLCLDDATVAHNHATTGNGGGAMLIPPAECDPNRGRFRKHHRRHWQRQHRESRWRHLRQCL